MPRRRLRLALGTAVLILSAWVTPAAAGGDAAPMATVEIEADATRLVGRAADGATLFEFDVDGWQSWARDHLADALGELPAIGDQVMTPDRFDRFGAAAPSPAGDRVLFSATVYAMLTTVSVLTVIDVDGLSLDVLTPVAMGDVESVAWSPDGRFVATVLGTARAQGERLRIDDVDAGRRVGAWTGADVLEAAARSGRDAVDDPEAWTPGFRDLDWADGDRLAFRSFDPAEAEARGSVVGTVDPRTGSLELQP